MKGEGKCGNQNTEVEMKSIRKVPLGVSFGCVEGSNHDRGKFMGLLAEQYQLGGGDDLSVFEQFKPKTCLVALFQNNTQLGPKLWL